MIYLLRFCLATIFGFLERIVGALVLCKVWAWWVMPLWPSAPSLTFLMSLGIGLVISTLLLPTSVLQARTLLALRDSDENQWVDLLWSGLSILILWPLALGIAWIFKWVLL